MVGRRGHEAQAERDHVEQLMLAEARAEVGMADTKASVLLAGLGIGAGALLAGLLAGRWEPADLPGGREVVWWIGAGSMLGSIAAAGAAVWPRYVKVDTSGGIHYWGHAATFERLEDLALALDSRSSPGGRGRTRHQLWRLSKIVSKKYMFVRVSMLLASSAVVLFVLSVLL